MICFLWGGGGGGGAEVWGCLWILVSFVVEGFGLWLRFQGFKVQLFNPERPVPPSMWHTCLEPRRVAERGGVCVGWSFVVFVA